MSESMKDIMHPGQKDSDYPNAPAGWRIEDAVAVADAESIEFGDDHRDMIRALQGLFARNPDPSVRAIHDALNEHFHAQGGMKYLYKILPGGPVAQGCRLAGLKAPAGSTDASFGSVQ